MNTYKGYEIHKTPGSRYNVRRPDGSFLKPMGKPSIAEAKAAINFDIEAKSI